MDHSRGVRTRGMKEAAAPLLRKEGGRSPPCQQASFELTLKSTKSQNSTLVDTHSTYTRNDMDVKKSVGACMVLITPKTDKHHKVCA